MPNLLKNIFTHDEIEYDGKLFFTDQASLKNFYNTLESVHENGSVIPVIGVESISFIGASKAGNYPLKKYDHISKFMIGPAIEHIRFEIQADNEKKTITMLRKVLNDKIILESTPDSVIHLTITFFKASDGHVIITYSTHYENAQTVSEVIEGINSATTILKHFTSTSDISTSTQKSLSLSDIINYFGSLSALLKRLLAIEQALEIHFLPIELKEISDENISDINDLYVLVCLKKTIRTNYRITSSEAKNLLKNEEIDEPPLGKQLLLTSRGNVIYSLFGNSIKLFTVCIAINVVVEQIIHTEDTIKILYRDSAANPMYISIKAFKTEEEANREAENIHDHVTEYIQAKKSIEYLNAIQRVEKE